MHEEAPFSNKTLILFLPQFDISLRPWICEMQAMYLYTIMARVVSLNAFSKKLPQQWLKLSASLFIKTSELTYSSIAFLKYLSNEVALLKLWFAIKSVN